MTPEEGKLLLQVARSAIESHFQQKKPLLPTTQSAGLLEKRGAFVTLHKRKGELRGCIGRLEPQGPLVQTVSEMAIEAAFHDPRFAPLRKEEWKEVSLEVSVLSDMRKIQDIREIVVGRDGLLIQRGAASGLLLPQVATENRWTRDLFLAYTCRKALLPEGAWKEAGTEIYTFTSEIFSEGSSHA